MKKRKRGEKEVFFHQTVSSFLKSWFLKWIYFLCNFWLVCYRKVQPFAKWPLVPLCKRPGTMELYRQTSQSNIFKKQNIFLKNLHVEMCLQTTVCNFGCSRYRFMLSCSAIQFLWNRFEKLPFSFLFNKPLLFCSWSWEGKEEERRWTR